MEDWFDIISKKSKARRKKHSKRTKKKKRRSGDNFKREKEEGLPEFTLRTDAENFDKWKVTNPLRLHDFDWIGGEKSKVSYSK